MLLEKHNYKDPKLKVFHQTFHLKKGRKNVLLHFHPSVEFLFMREGQMLVTCNGVEQIYSPNEIAIINSNNMHKAEPLTDEAVYDCLIVDLSVCDVGQLPERSSNIAAIDTFKLIMRELENQDPEYREIVTGYIKVFQSLLIRHASEYAVSRNDSRKYQYLRSAIDFMSQHFSEDISLDDISKAIPLNKYYLSHISKELTGRSILDNLNYIRCNNALSMLMTGKYSVTECAHASGFTDPSYFSRVYKKHMYRNPTQDLPKKSKK